MQYRCTTVVSFAFLLLPLLLHLKKVSGACSSCLVSSVVAGSSSLAAFKGNKGTNIGARNHHHHQYRHHQNVHGFMALAMNQILAKFGKSTVRGGNHVGDFNSFLTYIAMKQLSTHFGCESAFLSSSRTLAHHHRGSLLKSENYAVRENDEDNNQDTRSTGDSDSLEKQGKPKSSSTNNVSAGMVGAIGIYKNFISPLLPPACRFLPTCSQYGVQAIEEFGPTKGAVLTAWRLMRCTPFGGKGYDPPKWPPVPYTYGSY